MKLSVNIRCLLAVLVSAALVSCGEEGKPRPGHLDPCQSAVGAVLGCSPTEALGQQGQPAAGTGFGVADACNKLVACGQLAGEWFGGYSNIDSCKNDGDCGPGRCLQPEGQKSRRCYVHRMDYAWCVARLSNPSTDRCGSGNFTQQDVALALECIARTQCIALGLPLAEKLRSSDSRSPVDKFTCKDGKTVVSTISTCDHGLLNY